MKKCQHCEKPATFHITELTDPDGPMMLHLCEEHASIYLSQANESESSNALASMLAKQLKMEQTAEEIATLDKKSCPICGITFAEFRKEGRLGCSYDYVCFQEDVEPLLKSIHGAKIHRGKRPTQQVSSPDRQNELILLRREMQEAVEKEDYERAGQLRDQIQELESAPSGKPDTQDQGEAESSGTEPDTES